MSNVKRYGFKLTFESGPPLWVRRLNMDGPVPQASLSTRPVAYKTESPRAVACTVHAETITLLLKPTKCEIVNLHKKRTLKPQLLFLLAINKGIHNSSYYELTSTRARANTIALTMMAKHLREDDNAFPKHMHSQIMDVLKMIENAESKPDSQPMTDLFAAFKRLAHWDVSVKSQVLDEPMLRAILAQREYEET